jgi:hypothetical protein
MLVGLVGSPRSWPSASHRAVATGEESGRKKMTGGTALSERERERESACGRAALLGRASAAGLRERERTAAHERTARSG